MIRRLIPGALALAVVGSVAFLVASFMDFRRLLVIGALLLILPVAAYLVRGAVRSRWSRRSLALLAGAVVLVAAVGSASAYRLVVFETCLERVGAEADLAGCDLSRADLAAENLRGADLSEANLAGADLRHARLQQADLTGADLSGADLGSAVLEAATLRSAVLDGATVGEAQFTGAVLDRAELRGVDLRKAGLARVSLAGTILDDANLSRADLRRRNLRGANARGAVLFATRLTGADLSSADLSGATMRRARLDSANLSSADLSGAMLREARLVGANLKAADLAGADLSKAVLDRAKLAGAKLRDARLQGASLVRTTGLSDSALATMLGVNQAGLARALIDRRVRLEARASMLRLLSRACRGRRVPGAARYPTGSFHPLAILGDRGGLSADTNHALRRGWEPMATRFAQLVACTEEVSDQIEVCPYTLVGGGGFASISRMSYSRRTRIVAAASGRTLFDQSLEGSTPPTCPARYSFSTFSTFITFGGTHIGFPRVRATLARYVGR